MLLASLLDLLLPVSCVVCGQADVAWCLACRGPGRPVTRQLGALTVVAADEYTGAVRTALLAYKERGVRALAGPLARHLDLALARAMIAVPAENHVLVPVPSARAAARERGGDHVLRLLRASRPGGPTGSVQIERVLRLAPGVRDSAGLGAQERVANLSRQMRAQPVSRQGARSSVILVDDVITSGATLREAARALTEQGWNVAAAATVAATARRRPGGTDTARTGVSGCVPIQRDPSSFLSDPGGVTRERGLALQ